MIVINKITRLKVKLWLMKIVGLTISDMLVVLCDLNNSSYLTIETTNKIEIILYIHPFGSIYCIRNLNTK